jgi:glycerophosphoryl diester phosphodiesterase
MSRPVRFPFLEHKGVLAFAHRGGALEAPENTMTAFAYAVGLGYRYLETDVYATRDGVLIAFHDDKLDRVTDRKGLVASLDYAQLREARIGGKEPIPQLEDLLGAWPEVRINIDPKHDAAIAPLILALKRTGAQHRVCVGSFSDKRIRQVQTAFEGKICTSLGPNGVMRVKLASLGLPGRRFVEGCAQVPRRHRGLTLVDRAFLRAADKAGIQVHVWTVDDPQEMNDLIDLGVDGIMTDRPKVLKEVLEARGLWQN